VGGVYWHRQFKEWERAEPVRLAVDLSEVGSYSAPFAQTCIFAHGEQCVLNVSPTFDTLDDWRAALKGFKGRIVIQRGDEKPVVDQDIEGETIKLREYRNEIKCQLVYTFPFKSGDYEFTLTILEPATALAGRKQVLTSCYLLCGLEYRPALYSFGFSIIGGLITLICAIILFRSLRRPTGRKCPT
jgi:hypothetical protein